ncbi:MAG TPA: SDR family NAD(P)-dependent oxidoreductase [Phenylobacterium sp.]|nr:SDR family NAD(P)-dependent oxidoreductase [Phenylobacterium sp.]
MRGRFKPLAGQVVVVTGADTGLGLEVARLAAKAGAAVVLAGVDEPAVRQACEEITKVGGRVHPVAGDVAQAQGCDRIARAGAARFGRIDSWVEASGREGGLAYAAQALVRYAGERQGPGALAGFGRSLGRTARIELRRARGKVAATLIKLPRDWRNDSPAEPAAQAALHAITKPMGEMAVAAHGERLTTATEVRKHPGVMVGVGVIALAGVAAWLGRDQIAKAAVAVRPKLARAVRPALVGAVKRRPLQAAKLAAKHPKEALKLARVLR